MKKQCLASEERGCEGEGQEKCVEVRSFLIFVGGGMQRAIQAVSGAAVVQEEGTSRGAGSNVVEVSTVEAD